MDAHYRCLFDLVGLQADGIALAWQVGIARGSPVADRLPRRGATVASLLHAMVAAKKETAQRLPKESRKPKGHVCEVKRWVV